MNTQTMQPVKIYVGVDPGKKGGLASLQDGKLASYIPMPPTTAELGYWLGLFLGTGATFVVEKAQTMPKQGIVSAFTYGKHFGGFEMAAYLCGCRYIEVPPGKWKKALSLSSDKNDSIRLCEQLFPEVNLLPGRCRKPHDGIAEAILLAEWGRRQGL